MPISPDPTTQAVAAGYDAVYAAMPNSPTLLSIWRRHGSGQDYPAGFEAISLITLSGLERLVAELRLGRGQTLVDLGCGMGGPGLWVARETGARLIGVDLSVAAVAGAATRARQLGMAEQARFATGSFAETGLEDGGADGCMSLDALQYAPDKRAAFVEAARLLKPGGRFVFTAFEIDPERAAGLPVLSVDPVADYRPLLSEAGFSIKAHEATTAWPDRMVAAYEAIVAAEDTLRAEMGEPAWLSLYAEVSVTLERRPYRSNALVVAQKA